MASGKASSSKKNRKYGRNKIACAVYKNSNRREHNKLRRLKKHAEKHPDDACAVSAIESCKKIIGAR